MNKEIKGKNKKIAIIAFIGVIVVAIVVVVLLLVSNNNSADNENNKISNKKTSKVLNTQVLTEEDNNKLNSLNLDDYDTGVIYDVPPGDFGSWRIDYNIPKQMKETVYSYIGSDEKIREYKYDDYFSIKIIIERGNVYFSKYDGEYKSGADYKVNDRYYDTFTHTRYISNQKSIEKIYTIDLYPTSNNKKYLLYGNKSDIRKPSNYQVSVTSKYENILENDKVKMLIDQLLNAQISEDLFSNTISDNNNDWVTGLYAFDYNDNFKDKMGVILMDIIVSNKYNPILFNSGHSYMTYQHSIDEVNYKEIRIYLHKDAWLNKIKNDIKNDIKSVNVDGNEYKYVYNSDGDMIINRKINKQFYYEIVITNYCNKIDDYTKCNKDSKLSEQEITSYIKDFSNLKFSESSVDLSL